MKRCLCRACYADHASDPAAYTYSEEWRRVCEARKVLKWPAEKRQAYYEAVAEARGEEAAMQLVADVKTERKRQGASDATGNGNERQAQGEGQDGRGQAAGGATAAGNC
jgi:hypothetical protein